MGKGSPEMYRLLPQPQGAVDSMKAGAVHRRSPHLVARCLATLFLLIFCIPVITLSFAIRAMVASSKASGFVLAAMLLYCLQQ